MKKITIIIALVLISQVSFAQLKEIPDKKIKNNNLVLGFINPKNFSLTHSFNMSYQVFGGNSVSLTSYTGTLSYKILNNLKVSADVTVQYSPYASLSSGTPGMNRDFQNSLSGVFLSRVSLDYRPAKNVFINIEYRNSPNSLYWYNNNPYSSWNDF